MEKRKFVIYDSEIEREYVVKMTMDEFKAIRRFIRLVDSISDGYCIEPIEDYEAEDLDDIKWTEY